MTKYMTIILFLFSLNNVFSQADENDSVMIYFRAFEKELMNRPLEVDSLTKVNGLVFTFTGSNDLTISKVVDNRFQIRRPNYLMTYYSKVGIYKIQILNDREEFVEPWWYIKKEKDGFSICFLMIPYFEDDFDSLDLTTLNWKKLKR